MSWVENRREGICPGWKNDWREYVLGVKNDVREYVLGVKNDVREYVLGGKTTGGNMS